MEVTTIGQFSLVYNVFSFTVATMAAATLFFWINRSQVAPEFRTAITITGLVTFIALYHYWRIFESWGQAYDINLVAGTISASTTYAYNEAYRYVDWLLTVPLLLIELILVMRLSKEETIKKGTTLALLAAAMIILGYPGEIATSDGQRWLWGILSMIPFLIIVYQLFVGLSKAIDAQPAEAKGLIKLARNLTVAAWFFYPVVYFLPLIVPLEGGTPKAIIEVGYSAADIVAKALFGVLIYQIAVRKSEAQGYQPQ
ncbi:bacteriorhodopsin-like [Wenzhouxiangella sp. EGI_FJ10409]|uniref:bacteriorhodopsin-like n=1 Tax=Wenzhouxiangella sp. EGI_FJ10409 TaxID=3243767 RepID=UPI0035D7FB45